MDRATIERALAEHGHVVAHAALHLGMHPNTLAYQVRRLGLYVPRPTVIPDQHHGAAALTVELENLRTQARAIVRAYLPGPHRAVHLRELELAQRAVIAKLRGALDGHAPTSARSSSTVRGQWRPDL